MAIMGPSTDAANRRTAVATVRASLLLAFAVGAAFVFLGAAFNDLDLKYARSTVSTRRCKKELFVLSIQDSTLCCETGYHEEDWVCAASFGASHRLFSSLWAVVLPLGPLLMTVLADVAASIHDARNGLCPLHMGAVKAHFARAVLYGAIVAYRTYVLYLAGGYLQSALQRGGGEDSTASSNGVGGSSRCWYASLTRDGGCRDAFDYSDHIVLYLAQYAIPVAIEVAYVHSRCHFNRLRMLTKYFLTALAALMLLGVVVRGVLLTSMFFHTGAESVTALAVVLFLLVAPLYWAADKVPWADIAVPGPLT